eukprot:6463636-Amphidinium_carterae.1
MDAVPEGVLEPPKCLKIFKSLPNLLHPSQRWGLAVVSSVIFVQLGVRLKILYFVWPFIGLIGVII